MCELSEREQKFVENICKYRYSSVNDLSAISKTDPERSAKFNLFLKGKSDTENLIRSLENAVNSFGLNTRGIIEAIKRDKDGYTKLIQLAYEWVDIWNNAEEHMTDPRNQASTKICKKIAEALISHDGYVVENHLFVGLRDCVLTMHKTLIQSATNIFATVLKDEHRSVKRVLEESYGEKDVRLPMI